MKKWKWVLPLLFVGMGCIQPVQAQSQEAAQLILNYEKLNLLKDILKQMKTGYDIVFTGYTKVKDITSGNFSLHKTFLDGLLEVNPRIKNYYRIADIIQAQVQLVNEYKSAFNRFKQGGVFSEQEISYLASVYKNLFDRSMQNLDELLMVITANKLRMSDDERIQAIDRIYKDMQEKLSFLRDFNGQTSVLQVQRQRGRDELKQMQILLDLKK